MTHSRQRGFTLPELMIVIAVAGILLAMAAPSFYEFIRLQRLKGVHAQVITDMQFARTEAAARNRVVNVRVMPANASNPISCYVLFTDTGVAPPSNRCNCTLAEGNRCTAAGTSEIRTVLVDRRDGVSLALPAEQADYFAFDPITSGVLLAVSEAGVGAGNEFMVISSLDTSRSLAARVGLTGRPSACKPNGSTMSEPDC